MGLQNAIHSIEISKLVASYMTCINWTIQNCHIPKLLPTINVSTLQIIHAYYFTHRIVMCFLCELLYCKIYIKYMQNTLVYVPSTYLCSFCIYLNYS